MPEPDSNNEAGELDGIFSRCPKCKKLSVCPSTPPHLCISEGCGYRNGELMIPPDVVIFPEDQWSI